MEIPSATDLNEFNRVLLATAQLTEPIQAVKLGVYLIFVHL